MDTIKNTIKNIFSPKPSVSSPINKEENIQKFEKQNYTLKEPENKPQEKTSSNWFGNTFSSTKTTATTQGGRRKKTNKKRGKTNKKGGRRRKTNRK